MMNFKFIRFLSLICFAGILITCNTKQQVEATSAPADPYDPSKPVSRIAFGSCNKHDVKPVLWDDIAKADPDVWIWLGDIIYGDTEDVQLLETKYEKQNNVAGYNTVKESASIVGIWDDHDYGANNSGKEYPKKAESRDILFDFLELPDQHPARSREGAYHSMVFGPDGKRVKIILLDVRYFRDLRPGEKATQLQLDTSDILGEAQWNWLASELDPGSAELFILCSGIQMLHEQHPYEKWSNYPAAHKRLLHLIKSSGLENIILLSGDRHLGEISKISLEGRSTPLYEITSSGM